MPISLGTSSLLDFSNTRSKEVLSFLEEASHPLVPTTLTIPTTPFPKKAKKGGSTLLPSNASNASNPSNQIPQILQALQMLQTPPPLFYCSFWSPAPVRDAVLNWPVIGWGPCPCG